MSQHVLGGLHQINHTSLNFIEIEISRNKTLLGVILDAHIKFLCRNPAQTLSALCQINNYLSYNQKLLFVNSVIKCHLPIAL